MGVRLAWRSFQNGDQVLGVLKDLPLGRAARFGLFLGQMSSLIFHFALVESHGGSWERIPDMTTDSTDFRIEIRHCIMPSHAYIWEIYSVRKLKRVKRSSRSYPTRGTAMKAGKKALLRMIVPPRDQLVA